MKLQWLLVMCCLSTLYGADEWTWVISKDFSTEECRGKEHVLERMGLPTFSQLILSWNALRPEKGFYRFWAQVKDARTKQWHGWHRVSDWGAGVQKSYFSSADSGTKYHHVRLEMPKGSLANAVRLRVEACGGAPLAGVKLLTANIANLRQFTPERFSVALQKLPSVMIGDIPQQSQMILSHEKAKVMCSPTSCAMALGFLNKTEVDPVSFAQSAYDNGLQAYGSWPFNIAHAYERSNGKALFRVMRFNSFADLHKQLILQRPVVVSVRGDLPGAPQSFPKGHLLLVVGYDQKTQSVVCHDPSWESDELVRVSYDVSGFLKAWGRSHHLAYTMEPRPL